MKRSPVLPWILALAFAFSIICLPFLIGSKNDPSGLDSLFFAVFLILFLLAIPLAMVFTRVAARAAVAKPVQNVPLKRMSAKAKRNSVFVAVVLVIIIVLVVINFTSGTLG